ncbi:MAG: tripartite tricarboxylate transporter substrate binding protein [Pseudomonadota bacterium]
MYTTLSRRVALRVLAAAALALTTAGASAQEWPAKPIRIVSPYAAGGVGDTIFRVIAPVLEARLGQRFLIDNKTGAAGNIGTADVVNARPDGYTFLFAPTANYAVNQHLFNNLGFDPVTHLDAIATVAEAPLIAVGGANAPATLKDFASQARNNPGKFNFGSPGAGSPTHLAGVSFSQLAGNSMVHIAYRGTPPLTLAMLGGDVQLAFPTLTPVGAHLRAGKLKALAVMGTQRIPELPGVPTAAEAGFPDLVFGNWWVLAAPKGLDPKVAARLGSEVRAALADPAIRARLGEIGHVAVGLGPAESAAFIRTESTRYKALIERNGIKLD